MRDEPINPFGPRVPARGVDNGDLYATSIASMRRASLEASGVRAEATNTPGSEPWSLRDTHLTILAAEGRRGGAKPQMGQHRVR